MKILLTIILILIIVNSVFMRKNSFFPAKISHILLFDLSMIISFLLIIFIGLLIGYFFNCMRILLVISLLFILLIEITFLFEEINDYRNKKNEI